MRTMMSTQKKIDPETAKQLICIAMKMRDRSYCPYSKFSVGAALLAGNGSIYTGCNVENAAYPAGIFAERTAFVKALSEGERECRAIAIVGGKSRAAEDYSWPCGECRQFMREFCETDSFLVITALDETDYRVLTLGELLPESFGPDNLI